MHKKLIEAALFMSGKPLGLNELAKITGINSLGYVKELLKNLKEEYKERGVDIISSSQGWEMQVSQDVLPKVAHLAPYTDMSEGSKRSLAIIAAKEPLKQSELIKVQGNKAYSYVKELGRMGLVKSEKFRRSRVLSLTSEFERYFGSEKEKIKERLRKEMEIGKEKITDFIEDEKQELKTDSTKVKIEAHAKPQKGAEKANTTKEHKMHKEPSDKTEKKEAVKDSGKKTLESASSGEIGW